MADMKLLKQLRKMTHAPLKDCKSALDEAGDDLDRAQQILREKGAAKAAKKADRETNEWVVLVRQVGDKTVGVKVACETDFVAKNPTFVGLVEQAIAIIAKEDVAASLADLSEATTTAVDALFKENFVTIGENMRLLEAFVAIGNTYIYNHSGNGIASVVFYEGDETAAKWVALQIVAMDPQYLVETEISEEKRNEIKEKLAQEVKESGKPEAIHEQIIQWKLRKAYSEFVLVHQTSIMDDSKSVGKLLEQSWTTVTKFIRLAI